MSFARATAATRLMFRTNVLRAPARALIAPSFSFVRLFSNKLNPDSIVSTYSEGPVLLKFTPEHEWVSIHPDGTAFVGITSYAADALGDATFIELPSELVGEAVAKGETIGSVESVKSASDIYSPVDGEVSAANEQLESKPALINDDPMGEGWIAKIKTEEGFQGDELLSEEEYVKLLEDADE